MRMKQSSSLKSIFAHRYVLNSSINYLVRKHLNLRWLRIWSSSEKDLARKHWLQHNNCLKIWSALSHSSTRKFMKTQGRSWCSSRALTRETLRIVERGRRAQIFIIRSSKRVQFASALKNEIWGQLIYHFGFPGKKNKVDKLLM